MPASATPLPLSFYSRETLLVARDLLGMHLVHAGPGRTAGRPDRRDRGVQGTARPGRPFRARPHEAHRSHVRAAGPRVRLLHLWILELPQRRDRCGGVPHAVLIRALEPVAGIGDTTHGPGLLCRAMHIDRELNGVSLREPPLWIERPAGYRRPRVARSERIGVDYAGDWALKPWRFFDRDSPYVSTVSPAQRKKALAKV